MLIKLEVCGAGIRMQPGRKLLGSLWDILIRPYPQAYRAKIQFYEAGPKKKFLKKLAFNMTSSTLPICVRKRFASLCS